MTFSVVILSARAANLVPTVRALLASEPALAPGQIVVVDDGARAQAEAALPPLRWVAGVKPFIFARNANLGIRAAAGDVILLNDDARLITPGGFTRLVEQARDRPTLGACSAGVLGVVANPRQHPTARPHLRLEERMLAFVCVFIPWAAYERVGPLDERFVGYGFDDNDYCLRVRAAGLELGIWDGCVVDHSGALPSTYRTRADIGALVRQNHRIFLAKQREVAMPRYEPVDLFYPAWNRLEFTRESFGALLANTDWPLVRELVVYDDGSTDGTREWLAEAVGRVPARVRFLQTSFGSPVTAMLDFIEHAEAPMLAKVDNDAMMPPGWLRASLEVMARHPELDLLGIEAMHPHSDDPDSPRSYAPADYISGLGLYRRAAFARSRPEMFNKYYGLEEWQIAQGQQALRRGWITPALPVFLLDRVPLPPWVDLSERYIGQGWQRPWQRYAPDCPLWRWRWPAGPGAPEDGALRLNLAHFPAPAAGFTNVACLEGPGVKVADLCQPWPWADGSVAEVRAHDLVEHLPDKIFTMNELWRVLRPGGTAEIVVPTTDGTGAFQDPTHVSFWNRRSFLYYEAGNPYRERFAAHYGISARFRVVREQTDQTIDGPRLTIVLQAVKDTGGE